VEVTHPGDGIEGKSDLSNGGCVCHLWDQDLNIFRAHCFRPGKAIKEFSMRWVPALILAAMPLSASAANTSLNPQSAPKGTYRLDPGHTLVQFCIPHMGISNYCGRFGKVSGSITFNGAQPEKSSARIEVDVGSLDTPSDPLDEKLRTQFFETDKYPIARFISSGIRVTGDRTGIIAGQLELHGVKKPVEIAVTFNGGLMHPFSNAYAIGFSGTTTIALEDFAFPDVSWRSFVGDAAKLTLEVEFIAEK
jgi:polyisoprenoid-binding protein YceI